jgi:uncharacterized membrane protein YfcA
MTPGIAVAYALAALIGVSLGLLGSGGSIITLPILVYVAGIPVSQAVGMSLVIVGGTAAVGSYRRFRQGDLALHPAVIFAATGMAGSFFGARLTHLVAPKLLLLLFGCLMLGVGVAMLRKREEKNVGAALHLTKCLAVGLVVGIITGFLGVGGGFLILPALVLFAGIDMKKALGTSLAVIAVNSLSGLAGQLLYVHFNWRLTLGFLAISVLGMFLGLAVANRLAAESLRRAFAWAIIALSIFLLYSNLGIAWFGSTYHPGSSPFR